MNIRVLKKLLIFFLFLFLNIPVFSQPSILKEAESGMIKATKFMMDSISTNGGFVWYYLPDLSRRWGEMEAYPTQIWVQDGGTVSVGHMLLDAYHATHNEYFYSCAQKAAAAMIWGQSHEGGWNYLIDFAGDKSLKQWYATIGKNGWRLEEFQHYYGNDTYDDDVTSDAARFLLRMYIEKLDPTYKPALDKAINFVLKSQYKNGGWPQRYPLMYDFNKHGHPDYTSYYTFNDDVIWENVNFLIQCYQVLGEQRFLDPIYRGMNFYRISQDKHGAWGQQYTLKMEVAGARTYEPAALLPRATYNHCMLLMRFYTYTGDRKYLAGIDKAIDWLESTKLPESMIANKRYTHPLNIDPATNQPIFVHRKGGNEKYGRYYVDTSSSNLLAHMPGWSYIDIQQLKAEYKRVSELTPEEATKDSPLLPGKFEHSGTPQNYYPLSRGYNFFRRADEDNVERIIASLDDQNRWLVKHVMISHPYIGDAVDSSMTTEYASTYVGDITDTSPYRDTSEQEYISTPAFIRNMEILIHYIETEKKKTTP